MIHHFGDPHFNEQATLDEFAKAVGIDLRDAPQPDTEDDEEEELNEVVLDDVEDEEDDYSAREENLAKADLWSRLHRAA